MDIENLSTTISSRRKELTTEREYLNLSYLITHYSPAYSLNWKEWFTNRIHDKSKLVFDLAEELMKNNGFDEPVVLSKEHKTVLNGMHRIMAHHITGIPKIYVSYTYPPELVNNYCICLDITVYDKNVSKNWDMLFNEIANTLSWRYTENNNSTWVKCEGDYCKGEIKELYLFLNNKNINLDNFSQAVNEKLTPYNIKVNKAKWI